MSNNIKQIPLFKVFMSPDVDGPLLDTVHSGWIGEGPKVKELEDTLKQYVGNKRLITCNSATSALTLAYHLALNQDSPKTYITDSSKEVITTPITCLATNTPIINQGAKIVWADVDPITGNISLEDVKNKTSKHTKAITVVHWGGNPCDIEEINDFAASNGIKTIEDGSHSWGMEYKGQLFGNHSDYCINSFQAIKHITSGDGGALWFRSEEDYRRADLLKWYGVDRAIKEGVDLRCEIDVAEVGYKFSMNDIAATIANENFKHLPELLNRCRDNAKFYDEAFKDKILFAPQNKDGNSSYWLYTIHANNRDELLAKLKEKGVMSSKVHSINTTHSAFQEFDKYHLPGAESFQKTHLCIPVGWWVSDEDREYVADMVIKYAK